MTPEPDPQFYGTARFNGVPIELWISKWKVKRTTFVRWYAKFEGQSEDDLHDTRSERPAHAIGLAILNRDENSELADRLYWPN